MNFGKNLHHFSLKSATISVLKRFPIGTHASTIVWLVVDLFFCYKSYLYISKENKDPRRMYRFIQFMRTLITTETMSNTFNEISRWTLMENLREFLWRIPSVWREINDNFKVLLDHSYKDVREGIAK